MLTLQWTDSLVLDLPPMEDVHREFVALLDHVVNASDAAPTLHLRSIGYNAATGRVQLPKTLPAQPFKVSPEVPVLHMTNHYQKTPALEWIAISFVATNPYWKRAKV
jgi:hypothetical protein